MTQQFISQIVNEGLLLALLVSAPPVVGSLVVGLLVSVLQAVTQIQEQSLSFVPKVIVVFGTLAWIGADLGRSLTTFARICFEGIATSVGP